MTEYREFGFAEPYLRGLVAGICAYEVVAITTHRVPTVSWFARKHPAIAAAVLAGLAVHFQPLDD